MNAQTKIEYATLAGAMSAAFAEIEGATKEANNPHFKTKYASLNSVIEAIKPALINHGLFFTQQPEPNDGGICVETVLHHASGESLSMGKLFVPADKNNAQGFGSALTYARRYALVTAFGVPVEDDDGNAASGSVAKGGSARDNSEGRQVSPTGTATNSQDERINDEQLVKIQMLLKSTRIDEVTFCRGMGMPQDARLFQLPQSKYDGAVESLERALEKMAKAETDTKARETA